MIKSKTNNIVLIGFMGVGKGTIARALIQKSKKIGLDTDDMIESMENRKIKTIFDEEGETYFRTLEKRVAKWLEKNVKNCIISTGGGFYKVDNLDEIGTIIYLQSSFEGILNRLKSHENAEQKLAKRPLLSDFEKAKKLFEERIVSYAKKADITISVENKSVNECINEIIKKLKIK
ncbi:MAG: shikimate kinase [Sulfurospirillaceae bacterium]|nr:shikimate kinase [Sulfurospirillaceae bacterium]